MLYFILVIFNFYTVDIVSFIHKYFNYKYLIEIYEFKYKNFKKEKIAKSQEESLDKFDTSNIYIYILYETKTLGENYFEN